MKTEGKKQEQAILLDGIVLTDRAIQCLRGLQDNDNDYLREARERIGETISELIFSIDYIETREPEILKLVKYMNDFNRDLKNLMKP